MRKTLLLALLTLPLLSEEPKLQPYLLWVKGNNAAGAFIRDRVAAAKAACQEACWNGVERKPGLVLAEQKDHADVIVSAEVDPRLSRGKVVTIIVLSRKGQILKAFGPGTYADIWGELLQWACCRNRLQ